jgi:ATP-dependent Lhr-like helicase
VVGDGTVIRRSADGDVHWWTWGGTAANRTLSASLGDLVDPRQRIGDQVLRLRHGADLRSVAVALDRAHSDDIRAPAVDSRGVAGLKFSAALPEALAVSTVSERLCDRESAAILLSEVRSLRTD